MILFRRMFLSVGLITLAMPGLLAEHAVWWVFPLAGGLAGFCAIAAVGPK